MPWSQTNTETAGHHNCDEFWHATSPTPGLRRGVLRAGYVQTGQSGRDPTAVWKALLCTEPAQLVTSFCANAIRCVC
jgi:hypothetical protein